MAPEPASLLAPGAAGPLPGTDTAGAEFLRDLSLDQVIAAVAGKRPERELIAAVLHRQVRDLDTLRYRHEIFADLEDTGLLAATRRFSAQLTTVRSHTGQLSKMRSPQQRQGWFLDAAAIYCAAVRALAGELDGRNLHSRGLRGLADYLAGYAGSPAFRALEAEATACKKDLAQVTYLLQIKGPRVDVARYAGEPDYSAEIEDTFARFAQGEAADYRITYRAPPGMTGVGENIAALVARLFPAEFGALERFCSVHGGFADPVIDQLDRELQFYQAWLDYLAPLRAAGLPFCYPDMTATSKDVFARETFDLALAARLTASGKPVVTNEFHLAGAERVLVVSGPNQGGKTTFARTFGQLHHLAAAGCPVPGRSARLFSADQILTHFEREDGISRPAGKLEDDLLRIQRALRTATPDSILIMNEIFGSTTLSDAQFLGRKVLAKVIELDLLCVLVTFIDELASLGPTVVSMASTVEPQDPAQRTYQVVRKPADGLAYALAIAARHGVTYEQLSRRLGA